MNIYQKLQAVQKAVSYVQKDKQIEGKYWAVTHDQVTALVRPHFVEQGIIVVPRLVSCEVIDTGRKSSNGTPILRFQGSYEVSFVNADEPTDVVMVPVAAHAEDMGDKAPGKALSYGTKYAVLKILMLESGENDEGRMPSPKLTADDLVNISQKIETAADLDSLRTVVEEAMEWAKDSDDPKAHAQIKAWGTTKAATFGASAPDRQPVKAKAEKVIAVGSPSVRVTPEELSDARMLVDIAAESNEPLAKAGMIKIIRAKLNQIGVTEERALAVHCLPSLDGITVSDGNVILKSIGQGKEYYA